MRILLFGVTALLFLLTGCNATKITPDQAELSTISPAFIVPKSSPGEVSFAFRTYCLNGPRDRSRMEEKLRNADYIPTRAARPGHMQIFVVDSRRPAIALKDTSCMVRAVSRTGQREKIVDYIARELPGAQPIRVDQFEDTWVTTTPEPGIIATERSYDYNNTLLYSVIFTRTGKTHSP